MNQCCFGYKEELFCNTCGSILTSSSKNIIDLFPDALEIISAYLGKKPYVFTGEVIFKYIYTAKEKSSVANERTCIFITLKDTDSNTIQTNLDYDYDDSFNVELGDIITCASSEGWQFSESLRIDKHDKAHVKTRDTAMIAFKHELRGNRLLDSVPAPTLSPPSNVRLLIFTLLYLFFGPILIYQVHNAFYPQSYHSPSSFGIALMATVPLGFVGWFHGYLNGKKHKRKIFERREIEYLSLMSLIEKIKESPLKAIGVKLRRPKLILYSRCYKCNSKNLEYSRFCSSCGEKLKQNNFSENNPHNSKEDFSLVVEPISTEPSALFEKSEVKEKTSLSPLTAKEIEISPIDRFKQEISDTTQFKHQVVTDYLQKKVMESNIKFQLTTLSFFGQVIRMDDKVEVRKKTEKLTWSDGRTTYTTYNHHRNSEASATLTLELPNGDKRQIDIPQSIMNNIKPDDWLSISFIQVREAGKHIHCFYEDVYNYTTKKDVATNQVKFKKSLLRGRAVYLFRPITLSLLLTACFLLWTAYDMIFRWSGLDYYNTYMFTVAPCIIVLFAYSIIGGLKRYPGNRKRFKDVNDGVYTFRRRLDELQPPLQQRLDDALKKK
ncbi:hypothetical protein AB4249_03160 [Vibrio sp. 10N.261.55.F4]|uniref:hypothetical protein n=1 Tax=Vibrio sp. 10N.261.55.F4 TaxID=3229692 RepID=UPI00354CD491